MSSTISDNASSSSNAVPQRGVQKIDYLAEDEIIPSQQWLVCSFVSSRGLLNCKINAFKIRGCYATKAEADERAKHLRDTDKQKFNIFVGEVGKWMEFDPDPNSIKDQQHSDKRLNDLLHNYTSEMEKTKQVHEDRVDEIRKRSKNTERFNEISDRLKSKAAKLKEEKLKNQNTNELVGTAPRAPPSVNDGGAVAEAIADEDIVAAPSGNRKKNKNKAKNLTEEKLAAREQALKEEYERLVADREKLRSKADSNVAISGEVGNMRRMYEQMISSSAVANK
jgi:hypothetical protein